MQYTTKKKRKRAYECNCDYHMSSSSVLNFFNQILWRCSKLIVFVPRFSSVSPFRELGVVPLELMVAIATVQCQGQWWKTGLRHSICYLRNFIKGNLNGRCQTVSYVNLWGWRLLKSFCLPIDLSLNVLGTASSEFYTTSLLLSSLCLLFLVSPLLLFLVCFLRCSLWLRLWIWWILRPMIQNGKNPQKYIRYNPEDLERMLAEFFEGKTWNDPRR